MPVFSLLSCISDVVEGPWWPLISPS
jgi:hypothetical protein